MTKRPIGDANTVFGFYPNRNVDVSLNELLRIMRINNVDKALTIFLARANPNYPELSRAEVNKYLEDRFSKAWVRFIQVTLGSRLDLKVWLQ
jgi:hypothetical protein